MFTTTKKKRVFNLVLLISLIVVVLVGIGLGVYFIVRDNTRSNLSKRELAFGKAVNESSLSPIEREFDVSLLPSNIKPSSVMAATDRYVAIKTSSNIYVVYNISQRAYVDIGAKTNFTSVLGFYGNLVLLENNSSKLLFNLESLTIVAILDNVSYSFESEHLLLTAQDNSTILFYENEQPVSNLFAVVLNVNTGIRVFSAYNTDDIINLSISDGLLIAYYASRTDIYALSTTPSLKRSYTNIADTSAYATNVTSTLTGQKYYISDYYRAFALADGVALVERSLITNKEDYDIAGSLSNGERRNYKNFYYVVDFNHNEEFEINSEGKIITPCDIALSNTYFAIIKTEIENKQTILEDKQSIVYYQIGKSQNVYMLFDIIEYDYYKYGKIIGFDKESLFTTGGSHSANLDFSGNVKEFDGLKDENSKITQSNYEHVIVTTSLLGEKRIYDYNGSSLSDSFFNLISPFTNGYAIANKGSNYYHVSSKGDVSLLNNFASEYSQYVFMGIGCYFTGSNGEYNVYDMDGELAYENVGLSVTYNNVAHEVAIAIEGQDIDKLLMITPVESKISSINIINSFAQRQESETFNPNLKTATTDEQIELKQQIYKKGSGNETDLIYYELSSEKQEAGGIATLNYYLQLDNLDTGLTYKSYDQLNAKEASLIPSFDQGTTTYPYIYKYEIEGSEEENFLNFIGVNFIGDGSHVTIAIIKLQDYNTSKSYYMVTLAISDAYLKQVNSSYQYTDNGGNSKRDFIFYDYLNDKMRAPVGSVVNGSKTLALSSEEMKSKLVGITWFDAVRPDQTPYVMGDGANAVTVTPRQVNLASAGFDGGLLFTTDTTNSMVLNFTLSNVYHEINQTSLSVLRGSGKVDLGRYYVTYVGSSLTIEAKAGYLITGFEIFGKNISDASYGGVSVGEAVSGEMQPFSSATYTILGNYSYVQLKYLNVIESYSYTEIHRYDKILQEKRDESGNIIYVNEDGEQVSSAEEGEPVMEVVEAQEPIVLGSFYYFYGYGSDIKDQRNPAQLGFENFENRTRIDVSEFGVDGFTLVGFRLYQVVNEERVYGKEILNKEGFLTKDAGDNVVADSYIMPAKNVAMYTLEGMYDANIYKVSYFIDETRYKKGMLPIQNANSEKINTKVQYYNVIGKTDGGELDDLYSVVDDEYNMNNWSELLGYSLYGYDFVGWFYNDSETGEAIQLKNGNIYSIAGDLNVYAKWEAHEYKLVFDANVGETGAYQDVAIGNFVYNIDTAVLAIDYKYKENLTNTETLTIGAGATFENVYKIVLFNNVFSGNATTWPTINAYHKEGGIIVEEYVFLGWYSDKEIENTDSYEAVVENMRKYTPASSLKTHEDLIEPNDDGERILTLYAHYKRVVYSYNLNTSVDSIVKDDSDQDIQYTDKITAEGSTTTAVKNRYATNGVFVSYDGSSNYEGEACYALNSQLPSAKSNAYVFYNVQNEVTKLNLFPSVGYYVSKITVQFASVAKPYIIEGTWTNGDKDVFTIDAEEEDVVVKNNGFNVYLELSPQSAPLYGKGGEQYPLCATISVEFASMKFKNTFSVVAPYEEGAEPEAGDGRVTSKQGQVIEFQDGIIYGYANSYMFVSGAEVTSATVANSYLQGVSIDGQRLIEFTYEFTQETVSVISASDPIFYHKISSTHELESSEWIKDVAENETYKKDVYILMTDADSDVVIASLTVIYKYSDGDTKPNLYTYELYLKNKQNHEIEVCFEDIRINVEFALYDEDYTEGENGLVPNPSEALNDRVVIVPTVGESFYGDYYTTEGKGTLAPSKTLSYTITPRDRYFINSVHIAYNGTDMLVTNPTVSVGNDGNNIKLSQEVGLSSNSFGVATPLSFDGTSIVYFESTNISFVWRGGDRGFVVTINGALHDVKIRFTVLEYKLFQVQAPGAPEDTFTISEVLKKAMTTSLPDAGELVEKGIYYTQETGTTGSIQAGIYYCNWLIAGMHESVNEVSLEPRIDGEISYKIESITPIDTSVIEKINSEDGVKVIYYANNTSDGGNKASVVLSVDQASLVVNSYLGRGTELKESISASISGITPKGSTDGQLYTLDTNAFYFGADQGPFSDILAKYTEPIYGTSTEKQYKSSETGSDGQTFSYINVAFTGGQIQIIINKIEGYMLSTLVVEFYLVERNIGGVGSETHTYTQLTGDYVVAEDGAIDGLNGQEIITLKVPKLDNSSYELRVFQKPIEYELIYDRVLEEGNDPTGDVANTTHLYNVPSSIRTNAVYNKVGYTLIGYSKEKKTGTDLKVSDCDFLLSGFVDDLAPTKSSAIGENLWSGYEDDEEKTTTLYAVYQANTYKINYMYNDKNAGSGSSVVEIVKENSTEVVFDHSFGNLSEITRFGYTFDGWYTHLDGGEEITSSTILDVELYNIIKHEQDEGVVTIYAHYTKNSFTIIFDTNSISNGSSLAETEGELSQTITFDSDTEIIYPTITRIGYDFKGYRSVKTSAGAAEGLTSNDYINQSTYTLLNWELISNNGFDAQAIEESKQITLYATYVAQWFDVYINLNNQELSNYGAEFVVNYNSNDYIETDHYVDNLILKVKFDGKFGVLPTVTTAGYDFIDYYIKPDSVEMDDLIYAERTLNISLFEEAMYTDERGSNTSSSTLYESGLKQLSIYATFEPTKISVVYSGVGQYYLNTVDDILSYSTSDVGELLTGASNKSGDYGADFVIDILPSEGLYISTISINYNGLVTSITFSWTSSSKTVSMRISTGGGGTVSGYTKITGNYAEVANGMYIKVLSYAVETSELDTFRVILGFDFIKGAITVDSESQNQTFSVSLDGVSHRVNYGTSLSSLPVPEKTGKIFNGWKDVSTGEIVYDAEITSDKSYTAVFTDVQGDKSVTFYAWNPEKTAYENKGTYTDADGSYFTGANFTGVMPSPSSDAWPKGYYFSGWTTQSSSSYIIKPVGDFTNKSTIAGQISVYACYSAIDFKYDSFSVSSGKIVETEKTEIEGSYKSEESETEEGHIRTDWSRDYKVNVSVYLTIRTSDLYRIIYNKTATSSKVVAPVDLLNYELLVKHNGSLLSKGSKIRENAYTLDRLVYTTSFTYTETGWKEEWSELRDNINNNGTPNDVSDDFKDGQKYVRVTRVGETKSTYEDQKNKTISEEIEKQSETFIVFLGKRKEDEEGGYTIYNENGECYSNITRKSTYTISLSSVTLTYKRL